MAALIVAADATLTVLAIGAIGTFLGVVIAALSFMLYLRGQKGTDKDNAREEALALAETRKQRIDDLQADVDRLTKARTADRELHDAQIRGLRAEMSELEKRFSAASREFSAAQALTGRAVIDLVVHVTDLLERTPAEVDDALALLRAYTALPTTAPSPERSKR